MNTYQIEKDGPMWIVTQNGEFIDGGYETYEEAEVALDILNGMSDDEIAMKIFKMFWPKLARLVKLLK